MKIAVLGGGNGSLAAAGDFALNGHDVRLWRRAQADIDNHRRLGNRIAVRDGDGSREAELAMTTSDIAEAMKGAQLVFCPVPAHAQEDLAQAIAPHLVPGQVVFLPPGTLGSVVFARAAATAGTLEGVAFAETGTLPWLVRKHGFAEVLISTRAVRLPTGILPLVLKDQAIAVIGEAFPGVVESCGDVLSAALMNAGPIIHPPLILMNAGPLEHFEAWDIHNEGTQASIRRVTDRLDGERVATREALGYGAPHFPLADHYRDDGDEWMYNRKSRSNLTKSGDWREKIVLTEHRYMMEDVQLGLALLCSLADLAGVEAPVARGLLSIASAVCGREFARDGRTLATLGLGNLSRDELQALMRTGFAA